MSTWKTYKLGDIAEIIGGGTPSTIVEDNWNGSIPWLTPRDLTNYKYRYISKGERGITEIGLKNSSARLFPGGTVLLTSRAPIGYLAIAKNPLCTNQGFKSFVIDKGKVDNHFLYYLLKNSVEYIKSLGTGTTFSEVSGNVLKRIEFCFPENIIEQSRIASILSSLDDKIELNLQMNKTLEAIAQAIFKKWFVDFRFPGFDGELVEGLPKGWKKCKLGEAINVKGGTTPSTSKPEYWNGENYWATPKDLSFLTAPVLLTTERRITEEGIKQISSGILPKGTLLLSSRAPIGYFAITQIPVSINQGFIAIQGKLVSNLFMLFWLKINMDIIKARANGSTFQEISKSNFKEIEITVPSAETSKSFEQVITPIFERIVSNDKENQTLTLLRDTLLPKLMAGKIGTYD
jgi:type I restriction enzyme, S subunit